MSKRDTVTLILKRKDAGLIAKAIEHYQTKMGISKYEIRWGVNGLRMYFEKIKP
jgi:hypothetical protein